MANTNDMLTVFHTNYNFILRYRTYLITGRYDPKVYTLPMCLKKKGFAKAKDNLKTYKKLKKITSKQQNYASMTATNLGDGSKWLSSRNMKRNKKNKKNGDDNDSDSFLGL